MGQDNEKAIALRKQIVDDKQMQEFALALPGAIDAERFVRVALTTINRRRR